MHTFSPRLPSRARQADKQEAKKKLFLDFQVQSNTFLQFPFTNVTIVYISFLLYLFRELNKKTIPRLPSEKAAKICVQGGEGGVIWALRKDIFSGISFPYQSDHFRLNLHYFLKFNVLLFWQH